MNFIQNKGKKKIQKLQFGISVREATVQWESK